MSTLAPPKKLAGGATRANLAAGNTRKTGGYTKGLKTKGFTTTGTGGMEDLEYVNIAGVDVYVKPKPLVQKHVDKDKKEGTGIAEGSGAGSHQIDS